MSRAEGTDTAPASRAWLVGIIAFLLVLGGVAGLVVNRVKASQSEENEYVDALNPPQSKQSVPFRYHQLLIEKVPVALSAASVAKKVFVRRASGETLLISGRTGLPRPFFGESGWAHPPGVLMFGYDGSDPGPPLDDGRSGVPTTIELPAYPLWMLELWCYKGEIEADLTGLEMRFVKLQAVGDVRLTLPDRVLKRKALEGWPPPTMSRRGDTTVDVEISAPSTGTVFITVPPDSAIAVVNYGKKPLPGAKKAFDPGPGNVWIIGDWERAKHTYSIYADSSDPDEDMEGLQPSLVFKGLSK